MGMLMLTGAIVMFLSVPLVKFLIRKEVRQKKEKILLEIKESTSKKKMFFYLLIGFVFVFMINPENITVLTAFSKVVFLVSLYVLEELLKRKIIFTDKSVYVLETFKNKKIICVKELEKDELYDMEKIKESTYKLLYVGNENFGEKMIVKIDQNEKAFEVLVEHFKNKSKEDNKRIEIITNKKQTEKNMTDYITEYLVWMLFLFTSYGVMKNIWGLDQDLETIEKIIAAALAMHFIPFTLATFAYVFLITSKLAKKIKKVSFKKISFFVIIGSTTLPFISLGKNGFIQEERFVKILMFGIFVSILCILSAWLTGIIVKRLKERQLQKI